MILILTRDDWDPRQYARQQACKKPTCKAEPGHLCRRPNGRRTQAVHAERWPAAQPQQSERAA